MTLTRMDQATLEDWNAVAQAGQEWQSRMPERLKSMLLQLKGQAGGFEIDHLQHSLQTATRALRDGASEELIVAALCHDIGTAISIENHSAISAEIIKPYVSPAAYAIVRTHQVFQRSHYPVMWGKDVEARKQYSGKSWFRQACRFSDEWDQISFDRTYDTLPLEHFEALIDCIFSPAKNHQSREANIQRWTWIRAKRWIKQRIYQG